MRWLCALAAAATLLSTVGGSAAAAGTIVAFDPSRGEFPEGIAVGADRALYVSLAPLGEVRRFHADASEAFFSVQAGPSGLAVLGLAADRKGILYAAVADSPTAHGVWRIEPGGDAARLPGSAQIAFPNAIALDHKGTLYVTDSVLGAVWRIAPGGSAELWLADESLAGTGELNDEAFPLGANGIAYAQRRLFVANTEKKHVVEIPIDEADEPGVPRIFHSFGAADYLDGVAVDVVGNLYVCVAARNEVVRIDRSGELTTVATAQDGMSVPASLAFGTRGAEKRVLYVTSFSLPNFVPVPIPSVVALDVPLPGPPLP
jgi:sugar lactone lactonase YvrE